MKILFLLFTLCAYGNQPPASPPPVVMPDLAEMQRKIEAAHDKVDQAINAEEARLRQVPGKVEAKTQDLLEGAEADLQALAKQFTNPQPLENARLESFRRKFLSLMANRPFLAAVEGVVKHENRKAMLITQLVFFLFMILLRAQQQAKSKNWFSRLLLGFVFTIFTWVGLAYVIPLLALGEPFAVMTRTLWTVFTS